MTERTIPAFFYGLYMDEGVLRDKGVEPRHPRKAVVCGDRTRIGARATLLDLNVRRFYPQGYSAIALLAESHLSLHAWPELGYVALDVFTCGEADPQRIVQALEAHFKPRDTEYIKIPRGRMRANFLAAEPLPVPEPA